MMNTQDTNPAPTSLSASSKKKSSWLNLAVDYGPILIFFLVYRYFAPDDKQNTAGEVLAVIKSTAFFMATALFALGISKWKLGRLSPMLLLSTALILFFGTMTILLQEAFWIQIKPTVIYSVFGISLLWGWKQGKPLLKYMFEAAFDGLDDDGWMILSRNWGFFFLLLAATNEGLRHLLSFGGWLQAKLYIFMPASFLFTFLHVPMLMRHGMDQEPKV